MAPNHHVELVGLATTWNPFAAAEGSTFRRQFAPFAFNGWLRANGGTAPIQIDHKRGEQLYAVPETRLTATSKGLEFRATLNTWMELSKAAFLAVAHGWLPHMSVSWIARSEKLSHDTHGPLWLITRADLVEVSLVDDGLVPGTYVTLADKSLIKSTAPARPEKFADCQLLAGLIGRIDHRERFWSGERKPIPFHEPLLRETDEWKAAMATMQARDAKRKAAEADRRAVQSLYDGSVVVLDPRSGEMVPYGDFSCGGRPVLGVQSLCLV